MARPKDHDEAWYRDHIYGHWNPDEHSLIFLENQAFADLYREIEYYRENPQSVDPNVILQLVDRIMHTWRQERDQWEEQMQDLVEQMKVAVKIIKKNEREARRLQDLIDRLQQQVNEAVDRQNDLQQQIDRLERDKLNDAQLAQQYRNEAVQAYNEVVNDAYFKKYAQEELQAIRHLVHDMDNRQLANAAIQGLAIECIAKIYATRQKVDRMKTEFDFVHTLVTNRAQEVLEQYEHWRDEVFFDSETRQKHVDMDFWSHGRFGQQIQNVQGIVHNLGIAPTQPGYMIAQLRTDLKNLEQLMKEGEDVFEEVMNVSNLSELVEAMGLLASLILCEDYYYRLVSWGFNDDDERGAYVIQTENRADHARMQFVFSPIDQTHSVCFYQTCFEQYEDEMIADHLVRNILVQLQENGIQLQIPDHLHANIVDHLEFGNGHGGIHLDRRFLPMEA